MYLNFCLKINKYLDNMKFILTADTMVEQNDKLPVGLIAQLVEHCTALLKSRFECSFRPLRLRGS